MSKSWREAMRQARRVPKSKRPRQSVAAWARAVRKALGVASDK